MAPPAPLPYLIQNRESTGMLLLWHPCLTSFRIERARACCFCGTPMAPLASHGSAAVVASGSSGACAAWGHGGRNRENTLRELFSHFPSQRKGGSGTLCNFAAVSNTTCFEDAWHHVVRMLVKTWLKMCDGLRGKGNTRSGRACGRFAPQVHSVCHMRLRLMQQTWAVVPGILT